MSNTVWVARDTAAATGGVSSSLKSYTLSASTATMVTCSGRGTPIVRPSLSAVCSEVSWGEFRCLADRSGSASTGKA